MLSDVCLSFKGIGRVIVATGQQNFTLTFQSAQRICWLASHPNWLLVAAGTSFFLAEGRRNQTKKCTCLYITKREIFDFSFWISLRLLVWMRRRFSLCDDTRILCIRPVQLYSVHPYERVLSFYLVSGRSLLGGISYSCNK